MQVSRAREAPRRSPARPRTGEPAAEARGRHPALPASPAPWLRSARRWKPSLFSQLSLTRHLSCLENSPFLSCHTKSGFSRSPAVPGANLLAWGRCVGPSANTAPAARPSLSYGRAGARSGEPSVPGANGNYRSACQPPPGLTLPTLRGRRGPGDARHAGWGLRGRRPRHGAGGPGRRPGAGGGPCPGKGPSPATRPPSTPTVRRAVSPGGGRAGGAVL